MRDLRPEDEGCGEEDDDIPDPSGEEDDDIPDPSGEEDDDIPDPSGEEDDDIPDPSGEEDDDIPDPSGEEDDDIPDPSGEEDDDIPDPSGEEDDDIPDPSGEEDYSSSAMVKPLSVEGVMNTIALLSHFMDLDDVTTQQEYNLGFRIQSKNVMGYGLQGSTMKSDRCLRSQLVD
ncbi:secreted acidic protein 2-like [Amia ocellicauda]|uniref:secreted acidic protein 2-like n=1 Tax=Amia ocellicauda TaxID=2972642 RepID=UPI00346414E5